MARSARGHRLRHVSVYLLFVAVAALLMLPAVLGPSMLYDSFIISWVWANQFTSEIARGNLYPRWLPLSNSGLGSPVFYYYPPIAFYVTDTLPKRRSRQT